MNEVEKMYENARVKVKRNYYCPECESLLEDWYSGDDYIEYKCTDCEYAVDNRMEELNTLKFIDIYPPFTAEKQLNIIKWLLKNYDIDFSQLGQRIDTSLDGVNCISGLGSGDTFEESLAQAINDLWQDLTEEERKQIRGILE